MDRVLSIEQAIETKREALYLVGTQYGLHSEEALRISHELDDLLNEYSHLLHAAH